MLAHFARSFPTDTTSTGYLEEVGSLVLDRLSRQELLFLSSVGWERENQHLLDNQY